MTDGAEVIAGRYRRLSRVGGGGMGVVWQAHDELLGRTVAVKVLRDSIAMSGTQIEQTHNRARREARIAARLQHPHAVSVYDVVEHEGRPCLVMEYVPSHSLAEVLAGGVMLDPGEVASIGAQVASALIAAHKAGIVHRDIKPANILLAEDGTAKLTDFGISRTIDDVTVTGTGEMLGTPAYISPEAARGRTADAASDVFSLGATLYAAVEGTPPFGTGPTAMALLARIVNNEIRQPVHTGAVMSTVMRMLRRDPAARPSMEVVLQELQAIAPTPRSRSRLLVGALVAVAAVLTATTVAVITAQGSDGATANAAPPPTHSVAASPTSTVALQMSEAISQYYGLVPGHLDKAWKYLTPYYQQTRAGGYATFKQFWGQIRSVSISDLEAVPPLAVVVTIEYVYKNGQTVRERTSFGVVEQSGAWKIASSSVLSSTRQ